MVPVPVFSPGVTVKSVATGGSRVTNPSVDPPAPLPNGGFNFAGNYESVLSFQAQYNARLPLSVNAQGNLVVGGFVF